MQQLEVLIPLSNYFSGHDLDFDLKKTSGEIEGITIDHKVIAKYEQSESKLQTETSSPVDVLEFNKNGVWTVVVDEAKAEIYEHKHGENETVMEWKSTIDFTCTVYKAAVFMLSGKVIMLVECGTNLD